MAHYVDLAHELGLSLCEDCAFYNHDGGQVDPTGRIHWRRRMLRRATIHRFVWLASKAAVSDDRTTPQWHRYFTRVRWSQRVLAHTAHIRVPRVAWEHQRATLRALLALPRDFFLEPYESDLAATRKAARHWAARGVDRRQRPT